MAFEEPDIVAKFDRSYGDKKEELRLERGFYNGKPTYSLRLHWQTPDGVWRWAAQTPTQSGKCWERLNLKARELEALGKALILLSKDAPGAPQQQRRAPVFAEPGHDDIPF